MFICDECHEKEKICDYVHLFKNYGACEVCGKVAMCSDCKIHKEEGVKN